MDMLQALEPTADSDWLLIEQGYDPVREVSIESRFSVSNGFLGVRGARAVSRGPTWVSWLQHLKWASWPRTFIAGLFDTPNIDPPVPALVPAPDWLRVRVHLDGAPVLQHLGEKLHHQRILDMRRGALLTQWRHRHPSGVVVKVSTYRAVSLADRRLGLQLVRLEVEDEAAHEISLEARFGQMGGGLDADRLEQDLGVWCTEQSGKSLAIACSASLQLNGTELPGRAPSPFHWSWHWTAEAGLAASFQRMIAVARGDGPDSDPSREALNALDRAKRGGWRDVLAQHETAWAERWQLSDIEVVGDSAAREALRFAIYHLNGAANPEDERVSIGARALTGDAYLGHVFWDTETYVLPFYIATWPEAARALLMYRYHTLPAARGKAARMGWRGAMYAWESADTGEETTPERVLDPRGATIRVLCGIQEQHITADVAYAVWQYWEATGDDRFMLDAGAEIMLETARFWASRAVLEHDGRRHIRDVIGPDEYHESIDDSAYTNVLARWNIRRGIDIATTLRNAGKTAGNSFQPNSVMMTSSCGTGRRLPIRCSSTSIRTTDCSSSSPASSHSRRLIWRSMPATHCRWTSCSDASECRGRRSSSKPTLSLCSRCCRTNAMPRPGPRIFGSTQSVARTAARSARGCMLWLPRNWAIWTAHLDISAKRRPSICMAPATALAAAYTSRHSAACGRRQCSASPE